MIGIRDTKGLRKFQGVETVEFKPPLRSTSGLGWFRQLESDEVEGVS